MLRLFRRPGSPFWYVSGTIHGSRCRQSTGETGRREAERVRRDIEARLERRRPGRTAVFADALIAYLDQGGEARFLDSILDHFGAAALDAIDDQAMRAAAAALYPGAGAATIRRQLYTPVRAILNQAAREGFCNVPAFRAPRAEPPPARAAPPSWFAAVLPHCPAHLAALLLFMASTGCRIGEALAADLDLDAGTATIARTKSGRPRRVRIPPPVVEAITRAGGSFQYRRRDSVYKTLRRACAAAGVDYIPPHQAGRHTFATTLLEAGQSLAFVTAAGGWKSAALVIKTYGHLEQDQVDAEVERLAQNWHKSIKTTAK